MLGDSLQKQGWGWGGSFEENSLIFWPGHSGWRNWRSQEEACWGEWEGWGSWGWNRTNQEGQSF